jgi:hypothetical protein
MDGAMKAILAMLGYFSFAVIFGMALVATTWRERVGVRKARTDRR